MTRKIFTFEQLQIVVGQSDQVKDGAAIAPVKSRRVDVPMHQAMFVHVRHCARDLPENQEQSWRRKVRLAELLP